MTGIEPDVTVVGRKALEEREGGGNAVGVEKVGIGGRSTRHRSAGLFEASLRRDIEAGGLTLEELVTGPFEKEVVLEFG